MTLLFMDGFANGDYTYKWDIGGFDGGSNNSTPRVTGGYYGAFYSISSNTAISKSFTAANLIVMGFGVYTNTNAYVTFCGDSGASQHITVVRNTTTGLLEIRRGGTGGTLLATGTIPIFDLRWNYVEISCTISDTVGEVHVRLNGLTTDDASYTGDTKNGGTNTTIDKLILSKSLSQVTHYLTDVYILNGLGATNNTFLGDVTVRTLSPSGNGTDSQLLGSDGDSTNNYLLVDEHPFSSTDYNGSPTSGLRDTYTMSDLPSGVSSVYAVQVSALMSKSDATLATAKVAVRTGGTLYYGPTRALTTSNTGYYDLYETSPNTSVAWTISDVNAIESGMEVV